MDRTLHQNLAADAGRCHGESHARHSRHSNYEGRAEGKHELNDNIEDKSKALWICKPSTLTNRGYGIVILRGEKEVLDFVNKTISCPPIKLVEIWRDFNSISSFYIIC